MNDFFEDFDKKFEISTSVYDFSESTSFGYYDNFSIKKSPWRTKAEMKANPILENKTNYINGYINAEQQKQKQKQNKDENENENENENEPLINNERCERVVDRQLKQSMCLTIEPIKGSPQAECHQYVNSSDGEIPKIYAENSEGSGGIVQVIENDIEKRLTEFTPFTTTTTSTTSFSSSTLTQVKELCAATLARQNVNNKQASEQSDKQKYVCNEEIMSTYETEVKPVKLIIARKRFHEDASSSSKKYRKQKKHPKKRKLKKIKRNRVIEEEQEQQQEVLAIVGKQDDEHKLAKLVPNEIPNASYNTHKERESGQVAFKGSCDEKSLLRNGIQCQYSDKYVEYEHSVLTPEINKMQQCTPSGSWTFEDNNTNFFQQVEGITEKSITNEKLCISNTTTATTTTITKASTTTNICNNTELLVRVPLSALPPGFQQKLEKTQGALETEFKQECEQSARFTHGQAENEELPIKNVKIPTTTKAAYDEKQNLDIERSCLVDTDQSNFSSLFDGAFTTTEINKAPPNTPASVSDINNQDCSYFIHENISMNYSPINSNSIDNYMENFPTNFANNNGMTSTTKLLEHEHEHEHDLLSQLTVNASTLSGNCLSQQQLLLLQQQQEQQHSMLSPSHMSEMQDVETTLNCILNEMQDQHIYTPVSSHTDDFLNQSVYSPLTEPPITPCSSLFPESPADDTLSAASSPSQNYYQQQNQQLTQQQRQQHLEQQQQNSTCSQQASVAPAYVHDCFAEDSTQSELIGFQNNIPCFENIEQLSSPTSMDSSMTKHQNQQEQYLDVDVNVNVNVQVKEKNSQNVITEDNNNNKNCNNNNNNNNEHNGTSLMEGYLNMNNIAKLNNNNLRIVTEPISPIITKTTNEKISTSCTELQDFNASTFFRTKNSMVKIHNEITIDLEEEQRQQQQQQKEIINIDDDQNGNGNDDDEMKNCAEEYMQLLKEFEARQQEHELIENKKQKQVEDNIEEPKEIIKTEISDIITNTTTSTGTIEQQLLPQPQHQQQIIFTGQHAQPQPHIQQQQQQQYQHSYQILHQQQHQQQQSPAHVLPHYNVINLLQNSTAAPSSTTLTLNNGCINLLTTPTTTLTAQELQWNEAGTTYYINTADLYRHHSHNQHMTSSTTTTTAAASIEAGRGQTSGIYDASALFALQQKQQQQLLLLQQQQQQHRNVQTQELQHYQLAQKQSIQLPDHFNISQQQQLQLQQQQQHQQAHALINSNENYMQRLQHYQQSHHQNQLKQNEQLHQHQQQQQQQQQLMILTIPHKASEHHPQHQQQQQPTQQTQQQQQQQQHFQQSGQYETQTVYIQTPTQSTPVTDATNLIGSGISTTNLVGLTLHENVNNNGHNNNENVGMVVDKDAAGSLTNTSLPLELQMTTLPQQQEQPKQKNIKLNTKTKAQKRKPQKLKQTAITKNQVKQPAQNNVQKEEEEEDKHKKIDNKTNGNNNEIIKLLCRFCYKRQKFTNNLDYSNHIIAMHPSETPYNCPDCPMHFSRRNTRQQHIVSHHGGQQFKCAACTEVFFTQRSLDIHLLRHHSMQRCLQPEQTLIQQEKLEQEHLLKMKEQLKAKSEERDKSKRNTTGRGGGARRGRGKGRTRGNTKSMPETIDTTHITTIEKCKCRI